MDSVYSRSVAINTTRLIHQHCVNPSSTELEKQYLKLQLRLQNVEDMINIADFEKLINIKLVKLPYINASETFNYGNKECNSSLKDRPHNMALCPWHTALHYRLNRYPHLQTQAICNCKNCPNLAAPNDFQYSCQQFRVYKPVLEKGNCERGVYKWREALEPVSVACLCQRTAHINVR